MNNRWVKTIAGLAVVFLAVSLIGSFIGRGLRMRQIAFADGYRGNAPAQVEQQQPERAAPESGQATGPQVEQRGQDGRFNNQRDGRGHNSHAHGRGGHRGGSFIGGIFGFLGGLIRLAGLGLLILAGIVFFRDRGGSAAAADPADDDDDTPPSPDMTEAEIRAAMKRLGIDKIEL